MKWEEQITEVGGGCRGERLEGHSVLGKEIDLGTTCHLTILSIFGMFTIEYFEW